MSQDVMVPAKNQQKEIEQEALFKGKVDEITKMATATAMALSTGYCMERRFLSDFHDKNSMFGLYKRIDGKNSLDDIYWLKIDHVGKPETDNLDACFSALKNILRSCSIPKTKLLFLIIGKNRIFNIYIGIAYKPDHNVDDAKNAIHEVDSFINISWPGIKTHVLDDQDIGISSFTENVFNKAYAFTGIPSMDLEKTKYPSTLEYLLGGCKSEGDIAYLVVAEPIEEIEINSMIYQCEEICGQAESFKNFTVSHSLQKGYSDSITKTVSETIGHTETEGTSKRDMKSALLGLLGVGVAAGAVIAFPPLAAMAAGAGSAVTALVGSEVVAAQLLGGAGLAGAGILSSFIPQKSKSTSNSNQKTTSTAETHGITNSYTTTLSGTLVNGHMSTIAEQLKIYLNRIQEGKARGMWQVGCYLFTDSENVTSHIQLKSILSGEASRIEPIRIHDISKYTKNGNKKESVPFTTPPELYIEKKNDSDHNEFKHPMGWRNSSLTTLVTTDELTSFINFPLHSVPGISVVDVIPNFSLSPQNQSSRGPILEMGSLIYSGSLSSVNVGIPLDTLCRHSIVCGVNGSGKTNTVIKVLNGFMKESRPFLVIEPAKTEYVDWALEYNKRISDDSKKIKIFMPGCNSYAKGNVVPDKLRFNPFEVIRMEGADPHLLMHIDRLKASLASAFPMQDVIPVIMERLIYELYTEKGMITKDGEIKIENKFPTFEDANAPFVDKLMLELGYALENTQNISAALRTRIHSLRLGWKKELLCNEKLTGMTWDDLFDSPVIVNLSYAGDDQDRAFIMSLLLQFLYEYRIAESETGQVSFTDNVCRHLVVVEEAHRVMMKNDNPESIQYKAGMMFSNFLSEVRAYGQGMMIVDQIPTRLIDDAIKNTNIKIIHKIVAADDAEAMADSIGLSDDQKRALSKLSVGQAVLSGLNSAEVNSANCSDVYLAQIDEAK